MENGEIIGKIWDVPPPSILPPFQKIYLKYEINLSQHCIHLQSQVRDSWVRQQTKLKTNKMEQSVPINTGFEKLHFFQNYQNQGQSTEGKEKKEEEKQWQKEKSNLNLTSVSTVSNLKD